MAQHLDDAFLTIVRSLDALQELLDSDPYRPFRLGAGAKRVVTFLRDPPPSRLDLPIAWRGSRILAAFGAYVPHPKGPAFMTLIKRTFGEEHTTRTWETVAKVARKASG